MATLIDGVYYELIYIGDKGPIYYPTANQDGSPITYVDVDHVTEDFPADTDQIKAIKTTGVIHQETAPAPNSMQVIRACDIASGLGDITIPYGSKLVFKGLGGVDAWFVFVTGQLQLWIGGALVATWP